MLMFSYKFLLKFMFGIKGNIKNEKYTKIFKSLEYHYDTRTHTEKTEIYT